MLKVASQGLKSDLQGKILKHVVTNKGANYQTISRHTGKARVTNLQSLESLVKNRYVDKVRADLKNKKSKLTFRATTKGFWYAIAYLNVDVEEVLLEDDDLSQYREYLQGVRDKDGRREFMVNLARIIMNTNLFTNAGEIRTTDRQKLFEYGFIMGLVGAAGKYNFDGMKFFNTQTADSLKKILTPAELAETVSRFSEFKKKFSSVMDLFVKELGKG